MRNGNDAKGDVDPEDGGTNGVDAATDDDDVEHAVPTATVRAV